MSAPLLAAAPLPVSAASSVVRARDFEAAWLRARAAEMREPFKVHRKLWEFALIAQAFEERVGRPGAVAVGFGVGHEPLPAWLAGRGASVVATDLPSDAEDRWTTSGQHAEGRDGLRFNEICSREQFDAIEFRQVDMRAIPDDLLRGEADFTWSAGSFEHLGSIEAGLEFFCRAMRCLKPGGVAVHTTEYNYAAKRGGPTCNKADIVLFRAEDFEELARRLRAQGDELMPIDLALGDTQADRSVDAPPYRDEPHLRCRVGSWLTTSVALVALRGAGTAEARPAATSEARGGKMRVLIVGDAAVPTGFARCTHAAADALHAVGHEVAVLGINFQGDPHPHPYPIYSPRYFNEGADALGIGRLPHLVARLRPDAVLLLNDPWNVPDYVQTLDELLPSSIARPKMVGWLAVDAENQIGGHLAGLDHVMVWTEFAARELERGGYAGTLSVVPLGFDRERFSPRDRLEARTLLGHSPEVCRPGEWVVGVVGRNQYRKRLDLALEYFAEWVRSGGGEGAWLHLVVAPTGETAFNLRALVRYYGLHDYGRVLLTEQDAARGASDEGMALFYQSFDCLLSTSQAEGWNLPAMEAMACGTPVVVPDFAATGPFGWTGDAAARVPCKVRLASSPLRIAHTVGAIPDKAATVKALTDLRRGEGHRKVHRDRGLKLVADEAFSWASVGAAVVAELEAVVACESQEEEVAGAVG